MNTIPYTPAAKHRIAARFGRAADSYESAAMAQMEILGRVAEIMKRGIGAGELWCDIGSGNGMLLDRLPPPPDGARIICLDIAAQALRRAVQAGRTDMAVNGDIDIIPFKYDTFDGVSAVSMLQWVSSPETALRNIAKMLKASGRFYFSVFVEGAFSEIAALRERMKLGASVWLPTASEFFTMLDDAGFEVAEDEIQFFDKVLWFPDAMAALGSLSGIGATAAGGRLLNRSELDSLRRDYTTMFSKDGKTPLTYRAVIGKALRNRKFRNEE